jgi:hypothetical protein
MWSHFFRGTRALRDQGFDVTLALDDVPAPIKALIRLNLPRIPRVAQSASHPLKVRFSVTDVSGMEAVLLTSKIPALITEVISQPVPSRLTDVLVQKMLSRDSDVADMTVRYLDHADAIDEQHKAQVFGMQDHKLAAMTGSERMSWLTSYAQADAFWRAT